MRDIKSQLKSLKIVKRLPIENNLQKVKNEYYFLLLGTVRKRGTKFDREAFFERKSTEHKIQLSILRDYCTK